MKNNRRLHNTESLRFTTLAGLIALCVLAPLSAQAIGLGPLRVLSQSGQPLRAEVELSLADRKEASDVTVRNASAEEYARQGFGARGPLATMRVVIEQRGDKRVAVLSTTQPLNDTYTNIILEGSSGSGSALRSYPILLTVAALNEKPARPMVIERVLNGPVTAADFPEPVIATRSLAIRAPLVSDATRIYDSLIEIGQRPGPRVLERLTGTGNREPVGSALSRVVPKGWKGFAGDVNVKALQPINWTARNDYWIAVLNGVMSATTLTATINWPEKEVTFRGLDSTSISNSVATTAASTDSALTVVGSVSKPPAVVPAASSVLNVPSYAEPVSVSTVKDADEVLDVQKRISILSAQLAKLQARDEARLASAQAREREARSSPNSVAVVAESVKSMTSAAREETKTVKAMPVKTGNLTLDAAVRHVLPSDWSFLSNNQSALHVPRVAGAGGNQDWLTSVKTMIASQGGTVTVDHEKKRLLVSLAA